MEIIRKFLILSLLVCSTLPAQWSQDPNNNLQVSNFGYFVSACEDGIGGAFIAWGPPQGFFYEIWMQWVDKYGYVRWSTPKRIPGIGESQSNFNLLKAEKGKAIIVYYDSKLIGYSPPPSYPIFKHFITLNKIDTNGVLLWGDYGKRVTVDTNFAGTYNCVEDQNGGVFIQWNEMFRSQLIGESDSTIIRLQRISSIGERLWGDSGKAIYTIPKYYESSPSISKRYPEGIFLLYSRKYIGKTLESYNADGSLNWSKVNQWYGRIIPDSSHGGAWAGIFEKNPGKIQLIANRIDSLGNLSWGNPGIIIEDNIPYNRTYLADYRILDDNSLVILRNNYIQIVNMNGTLVFPDSPYIYTNSNGVVGGYKICLSDSNKFIITWLDYDSSYFYYYCQKFDKMCIKQWENGDVIYSGRNHEEFAFIGDGDYGFIDVWGRYYPYPGVYAQQVSKNGILGEVLTKVEIENNKNKEFNIYNNFPNPFNIETTIKYELKNNSFVEISIYNLLGQKIKTLIKQNQNTGLYNLIWNGRDSEENNVCSGVYLIEVKINNKIKVIKASLIK